MVKKSKLFIVLKVISSVLLVLSLICFFELYISTHWLKINEFTFESNKVGQSIKAVILSDLHYHDFNGKLTENLKRVEPDIILMAGDMINSDSDNPQMIYNLVSELNEVAPVYYGIGNHEEKYIDNINHNYLEELESYGCKVLEEEYVDLNIHNNIIRIGGLYKYPYALGACLAEDAEDDIKEFMNDFVNTDHFKILIAHRPESFVYGNDSEVYSIDMVVSGHIHGGQVIIPFIGGLYGGDQGWWPKYAHGIYKKNNIHMIVTSGLGTSKKKFPRFNNRPEIMVLTIQSPGEQ